jgi:hypothetical protein
VTDLSRSIPLTARHRAVLEGRAPLDEHTALVSQCPWLIDTPVESVLSMPASEALLFAGWIAGSCGDKTGALVTGNIREIERQVREALGRILPPQLQDGDAGTEPPERAEPSG